MKHESIKLFAGTANRAERLEEVKKELFVGLDHHAIIKLAEPQTMQPIMLPVTTRGINMETTQLAWVAACQYGNDLRVSDILYARYCVYVGLTRFYPQRVSTQTADVYYFLTNYLTWTIIVTAWP